MKGPNTGVGRSSGTWGMQAHCSGASYFSSFWNYSAEILLADITKSAVHAHSCTCAVHGRCRPAVAAVAASSLGYMLWTRYLVLWFHSLVVEPCLGFLVCPASRSLGFTSVSVFVGLSLYTLLLPCWLLDRSFLILSSPKPRAIPVSDLTQ